MWNNGQLKAANTCGTSCSLWTQKETPVHSLTHNSSLLTVLFSKLLRCSSWNKPSSVHGPDLCLCFGRFLAAGLFLLMEPLRPVAEQPLGDFSTLLFFFFFLSLSSSLPLNTGHLPLIEENPRSLEAFPCYLLQAVKKKKKKGRETHQYFQVWKHIIMCFLCAHADKMWLRMGAWDRPGKETRRKGIWNTEGVGLLYKDLFPMLRILLK